MVSLNDEDVDDMFEEDLSDEELEAQARGNAPLPPKKVAGKAPKALPDDLEDEFGRPIERVPQGKSKPQAKPQQTQQKSKPKPQESEKVDVVESYRYCVPFERPAASGFIDPQTKEILADDVPTMLALIYNKICNIEEQIGRI